VAAIIGLALVAYSLQGYLPWVGTIAVTPLGYTLRAVTTVAGLLLALPERVTTVVGLTVAAAAYVLAAVLGRAGRFGLVRPATGEAPRTAP
jgi:hypothetical protein